MKKTINIFVSGLVILMAALAVWFLAGNKEEPTTKIATEVVSAAEIKIVAFGDSLTAGYGLPSASSYPAQLERVLKSDGYDVSVINSGVSGETTKGSLERVDFIISQNPDIIILGIGGNDALRALPISETRINLENTILGLKEAENNPVILLLEMQAPLNAGLGYKREFDNMYEELAKKHNLALVPFLTAKIFLDSKNKLNDGIHYNELGYSLVVNEHIAPAVRKALDSL